MSPTQLADLRKRLSILKMRVELIAWRVEETGGMRPELRRAIPESTVDLFDVLLHDGEAPNEKALQIYEQAVRQTEEALARECFWRDGNETLH